MTFQQHHDLIDVLLDKNSLPWFNTEEKDMFLNLALNEYVKSAYRKFEVNEKVRQDIAPLVRSVRIEDQSSTFSISTLPDFMFFLRMVGYFADADGGDVNDTLWQHDENISNNPIGTGTVHDMMPLRKALTTKTTAVLQNTSRRSIQPTQLDDIEASRFDPFNAPSDKYPRYVVRADAKGHQYVEIFSDTEPLMIDVDYLKFPKQYDTTSNPNDVPELPEHTHEEIVNIAIRKMLENVESPRYPTQRVETLNAVNQSDIQQR